jgi:hypothetical protein
MVLKSKDGDHKLYSKNNDNMKIGEANLDRIIYVFSKDRFYLVTINFTGLANFTKIKETFFQTYGEGSQANKDIEKYWWLGDNENISLDYNKTSGAVILIYIYLPIYKEAAAKAK